MALCAAAQESIALRALCSTFNITFPRSTTIFEDNSGALAMENNPVHYAKAKHIDIKYHFTRECVQRHILQIVKLPTSEMLADAMTKSLNDNIFHKLRPRIMNYL